MTYQLLPFAILRQFDDSGHLLSGGKLYFYQAGTLAPKGVFQNSNGSVYHSNPVILSASGTSNIFLDTGNYDLRVYSSNDEFIGSVEGIVGSSGISSNQPINYSSSISCKLFEDVRNLINPFEQVYVSGRTSIGDGGEGIFERIPGSLLSDDNGIVLVSSTGDRYKRITNYIDPRWYGVVYNSLTNQSTALTNAIQASVNYKLPLIISDSIYITSTVSFTNGSETIFNLKGQIKSTTNVQVSFNTGSKLTGNNKCFNGLDLTFSNNTVPLISWIEETSDLLRLTRLTSSLVSGKVIVDESIRITDSSISIPDDIELEVQGIITLAATLGQLASLSITCKHLINPEYKQIFSISSNWSFFGIMDFGKRYMAPEEFGFTEYASTIIPLLSGNVLLNQAREYTDSIAASTQSFTVSNLNIKGVNRNSVINIYPNISGTKFNASNCGIKIPGEVSYTNAIFNNVIHYDFEATYTNLIANNCSLPFSKLIITNSNLSQVIDINADFNTEGQTWYVGKPTLIEPYINDIKNKQILATDSTGKVYGTSISNYGNMVVDANGIITGTLKPYIRSRVVTVPHSVNVDIVGQTNNFNFFFTQLPIQHNSIIQIGDTLSIVERNAAHGNIVLRLGIYERNGDVMTCLALTDSWNTVQSTPYVYWTKAITSVHTKVTMESDKRYYVGVYQYDTVDNATSSLGMLNMLVDGKEQACKGIAAQSPYTGQNITVTAYSAYIHHEYTPVG